MRKALLAITLLFSSCNCVSSFFALGPSKGTVDEQINYHQEEIKKYKARVNQEEHNAYRALSKSEISEMKRAQNRKAKYVEKIEEHTKELERLKASKRNSAITLVAVPTTRYEAEMREAIRSIEFQMSSLTQLKEFYIKRAGKARERGKHLQYRGYLMAAGQQFAIAAKSDAIVKQLKHRIGRLLLERDDLVRRSTNFYWSRPPEA